MSEAHWQQVIKWARLQRESRYVWRPAGEVEGSQDVTEGVLLLTVPPQGIYAVGLHCPHQAFSLERGAVDVDALTVECPLHRWVFSLETGAGVNQGGCLKTYATRVLAGWVWVCTVPVDRS